MQASFKQITEQSNSKPINPFTPKIKITILYTVFQSFLRILDKRIWCQIKQYPQNYVFLSLNHLFTCNSMISWGKIFIFGHSWKWKRSFWTTLNTQLKSSSMWLQEKVLRVWAVREKSWMRIVFKKFLLQMLLKKRSKKGSHFFVSKLVVVCFPAIGCL